MRLERNESTDSTTARQVPTHSTGGFCSDGSLSLGSSDRLLPHNDSNNDEAGRLERRQPSHLGWTTTTALSDWRRNVYHWRHVVTATNPRMTRSNEPDAPGIYKGLERRQIELRHDLERNATCKCPQMPPELHGPLFITKANSRPVCGPWATPEFFSCIACA